MKKKLHVAELSIVGSVSCLTCGNGDECNNRGVPKETKASVSYCVGIENRLYGKRLHKQEKLFTMFVFVCFISSASLFDVQ